MSSSATLIAEVRALDQRLRRLGEEIGRAEAQHGPGSEEYRGKVQEWNRHMREMGHLAESLDALAETAKNIRAEYGL